MPSVTNRLSRYVKCYLDLAPNKRPQSLEKLIDYCSDGQILLGQVRSEIIGLGALLRNLAPRRSLEIGTNYGGTLYLLCSLSPPDAQIISVDLPNGSFGGGYPKRKIPLYRRFPRSNQRLHLVRGDSHSTETLNRVKQLLAGNSLDYLFIDADHTYKGVESDFRQYSPLVRRGGVVAFHDIVTHRAGSECQVSVFWNEIKNQYRHEEFVEPVHDGVLPTAVTGSSMETSGIGVLYMP